MSASPTREESGFNLATPQPPPTRRGRHAHRRSAALSSHDLSIILQPPGALTAARGSSAPNSPADFNRPDVPPLPTIPTSLKLADPVPASTTAVRAESDLKSSTDVPELPVTPTKPVPRARVGFSETVEFIPRPLSLISSDTSSTVTAKPSHSVSGSISSIVSTSMSTPAEKGPVGQLELSPPHRNADSRPSTAGAVLERTPSTINVHGTEASPRRRNSNPALTQAKETSVNAVNAAEPSPTKTPKRWSFFGLDSFNSSQHSRARPDSSSSTEATKKEQEQPKSFVECVSEPGPLQAPSGSLHIKRKGKKPTKKVKTWAGSILVRKSKSRTKTPKCTRPASSHSEKTSGLYPGEDGGTQADERVAFPPQISIMRDDGSDFDAASPRVPSEEDVSYPVIDLDAALGPFNTPLPHNPEWEAAQKAAGNTKRRLHSAQGMKGFVGPGMHYHRRSESAPEMVPFEGAKFGIHRFGSNSTMADVFEEDEEEESSSSPSESENERDGASLASPAETSTSQVPSPHEADAAMPMHRAVRRKSSGLSDVLSAQTDQYLRPERSTGSLQGEIIHEDEQAVQFRMSSIFKTNGSPSSSAAPSPRRVLAARDLMPVDISPLQLPLVCHAPISPYSMTQSSAFPSPRSAISIDAQRISTAPSSVNEETSFQSLLLGQPGPEVRISVDDIPSLTSSNSTMTRDSTYLPNGANIRPVSFRADRPASVSSAAFGRRRSSLASLSRLISSSHGERSKLSMEISYENEPGKKHRASKTKRLSRLMQFWKAKETESHP